MFYINIYAVTKNQVSLLIKAKVFDLLRKKGRNLFVGQCQARKDSNNGAQTHTLRSMAVESYEFSPTPTLPL